MRNDIPFHLMKKIEKIGAVDIVVGVPCKNVETTIFHVLNVISDGLHKYFSEYKKMIVVSDGYSSDRTAELANIFQPYNGIEKIVTNDIIEGGKGAGVKTIFKIASKLDAKVVVLVDGDLLSIRSEWIYEFSSPVLYGRADLVVPYYIRDKYDGVITNSLAYPFTRALYGLDVRQPIAGEYGISKNLYEVLLRHPLFPNDFGIDIFIVTSASANEMEVKEGLFSLKIHESTTRYLEPETLIVPMFRQVTGTMFELAEYYENYWKSNRRKLSGRKAKIFLKQKPIPASVDTNKIREYFEREYEALKETIKIIIPPRLMEKVNKAVKNIGNFDAETWAEVVYSFAAFYKRVRDKKERNVALDALKTLWLGRFLSYAIETRDMDWNEAEEIIQRQARIFEDKMEYLLSIY